MRANPGRALLSASLAFAGAAVLGSAVASRDQLPGQPSACRLTCLLAESFAGCGFLLVLAHVMVRGGAAVPGSGWPSGAGFAGFRRTGRAGQVRADVPESSADPGGGEPAGRGGPFPGQAQVGGQRPGEAELGVAGDNQPGPPVSGAGVADSGGGPAEDLLEQPEGVF